jgi:hypothetical protein
MSSTIDSRPDVPESGIETAGAIAAAAQELASRLREAGGRIPGRWSESAEFSGCVDANELFPLVFAWRFRDPAVARDLVRSVLAGEQDSGDLPRAFRPDGQVAQAEPAWPLLAQSARLAYQADRRGDPEFLDRVLPGLFRIVGNQLDLFDPGDQGQPKWPTERAAFLPDVWDPRLRMVDLCAFLLAEIEALLELGMESASFVEDDSTARLERARRRLAETLERDLWSEGDAVFRDRLPEGAFIARATISGFTPLLWRGLPSRMRAAILHRLFAHGELWTDSGVAAWEGWPEDPGPPPVRAVDQVLLFAALESPGDEDARRRLRKVLLDRIGRESAAEDSLLAASFTREAPVGAPPAARERRIRWAALLGAGLLLTALVVGVILGNYRKTLTSSMTEVLTGLARDQVAKKNYEEAAAIYSRILGDSRASEPALHYLYANTLFHTGEYARAEEQYRLALRGEMLENPRVHFNRAQALVRLGRYDEAREIFRDLIDEYDDFPDLVHRCRLGLVYLERFNDPAMGGTP